MDINDLVEMFWGKISTPEKALIILTFMTYIILLFYEPTRAKILKSGSEGLMGLARVALLMTAGLFLGALFKNFVPKEIVAKILGEKSGLLGIAVGAGLGVPVVGGPSVYLPILTALYASGADIGPIMAFMYSKTCIGMGEFPLRLAYWSEVGAQKIAYLRVLIGLPMPFIAAYLAKLAEKILHL